MRSLVSSSIYAKKDRNGPPSANPVVSTAEPRCSHAIFTLPVQELLGMPATEKTVAMIREYSWQLSWH